MVFALNFYIGLLAAVLVASLIIILTASFKSKHFFKSLFLSAFSGLGGLFAVHVLSWFTPLSLPVNLFTACVSAAGGIPGVIALLITAVTV
ncbi:MAG: hypothetical protein E7538_03420 [Ruminococcaceae bacterium]|nr:hypothetical protein [Oscillospiraceae bacterium]